MTQFEYLAALISVVAALGVARTLGGIVRLVHGRATMRASAVHAMWTAALTLWLVQFWWFSFGLSNVEVWTLGQLFFVLLYAVLIYFVLALLYPAELPDDFDASAHLDSHRVWFFASLLALGLIELADSWLKSWVGTLGGLPSTSLGATTWYPLFMGLWILGSALAIRVSNPWFNRVFAASFLALVLAYGAAADVLGDFLVGNAP